MTRTTIKALAALAAVFGCTTAAMATTVNFSHLEIVLADPDNAAENERAAWTTWFTQVYEYNLPFIEVTNTEDVALEQFSISIGDTDFGFSNEFRNKEFTNSFPYAANGEFAIAGFSTRDVEFTSSVTDNGDTLVVDFGNGGLQPGEVVRFQVDIDADGTGPDVPLFPNYTEVFFNNGDNTDNSLITLAFAGDPGTVSDSLPDTVIDTAISQFFNAPRPHSVMQTVPTFADFSITGDPIPEPTTAMLAMLAAACAAGRHRLR